MFAPVCLWHFIWGWVSLQPSEKEAFRNGRAQEIQKLNEELAASQEKLQAALVAAEKASRAKTTFLSNMSHDIRTPMNAIVGLTTLLEHEIHEPEKLQLHIQKIQNSSQHLLGLINDILDMSKIESSEVKLNEDPVDLMEQVAQIDSIICPQKNGDRSLRSMFTGSIMDIFWETLCACARSLSICCPMLLNIHLLGEALSWI